MAITSSILAWAYDTRGPYWLCCPRCSSILDYMPRYNRDCSGLASLQTGRQHILRGPTLPTSTMSLEGTLRNLQMTRARGHWKPQRTRTAQWHEGSAVRSTLAKCKFDSALVTWCPRGHSLGTIVAPAHK
eukprot:5102707-Prymnesium_polylepis.1